VVMLVWDSDGRLSHVCGVWCATSCGVGEVVECCVSDMPLFISIVPDSSR